MVAFSAAVFVMTILAMVAVIFSDPNAPVAKFFNANAGRLIAAEVVVTLVVGLLALIVDRLQTRRKSQAEQSGETSADASSQKKRQNLKFVNVSFVSWL